MIELISFVTIAVLPRIENTDLELLFSNLFINFFLVVNTKSSDVATKIINCTEKLVVGKIDSTIPTIAAPTANHNAKKPTVNISIMANTTANKIQAIGDIESPLSI